MKLKASVLGAGSWGTTVASLMADNVPTMLWARSSDVANDIQANRCNSAYLGEARLSDHLTATDDFEAAVAHADILVMGVPSKAMRETLERAAKTIRPWVPVISLAKGVEADTYYRMTEIIAEVLPGHPPGTLTGPNLAREIVAKQNAATTLAMEDETIVRRLRPIFAAPHFRVYSNTDVVGCELGGAFKNVIAIATGMSDGMGAGDNSRAALITRGLVEIMRLGVAMGGRAETFAGLAGMGDLLATCTSTLSRNHSVGVKLGQGLSIDDIIAQMNQVAEGVKTARVVHDLIGKYDLDMPICEQVYRVCHEGVTARDAAHALTAREAGDEDIPR